MKLKNSINKIRKKTYQRERERERERDGLVRFGRNGHWRVSGVVRDFGVFKVSGELMMDLGLKTRVGLD